MYFVLVRMDYPRKMPGCRFIQVLLGLKLFFLCREDRERELRQQKENERQEKLKKQQEEELRRKEEEKKRKAEEKAAKSKAIREAKGFFFCCFAHCCHQGLANLHGNLAVGRSTPKRLINIATV